MNITVYLGSSFGNDPAFAEETKALGTWIGKKGHRLVYGGSHLELMGVLCDAVIENGGEVTGVMPGFMFAAGRNHPAVAVETVGDMAQRKARMMELGDVFIALPGGIGTLEEISEAISALRLRLHGRPCFFLNVSGYYDPLEEMFAAMAESGFIRKEDLAGVRFAKTAAELIALLRDL